MSIILTSLKLLVIVASFVWRVKTTLEVCDCWWRPCRPALRCAFAIWLLLGRVKFNSYIEARFRVIRLAMVRLHKFAGLGKILLKFI